MTISIKATRSQLGGGSPVSIQGPTVIIKGASNNYTITDFDSFSAWEVSTTVGTVSRVNETITLTVGSSETATTLQMSVTRNGNTVVKDVAIGAQAVGTPSILSPSSGATDVGIPVSLLATPFTPYPTGSDTHKWSDWRIKNLAGTVIWESLNDTVNKTNITVPTASLSPNTQYFAEVRYTGNVLGSSSYSSANQFTTSAVSIVRPSVLTPSNGATGINATPTFTSSAFTTIPTGSDTHASSNWRVKDTSTGTVVWSSLNDTVNKTSITVPSGILAVSKEYSVEVQYLGSILPASQWSVVTTFTTAATFAYDRYVSVGLSSGPPYRQLYGQDIDTFNALVSTGGGPSSSVRCCAFSQDGVYSAYGQDGTPFLLLYKRTGDSFARIALPDIPPNGVRGVSFSPDSTYMAVSVTVSPFLIIYKRSGDVFTKLPNPATLPTAEATCIAFSADGLSLAVCFGTTQSNVYNRVGDTFTRVATPSNGGLANGMCFSADGIYLAIATTGTPFINIYKRSGDVFAKLPSPSTLPTGVGNDVAFSADGVYLSVAHANTPFVTNYKRSGDTFTKIANLGTLPTDHATGVAYSLDGVNLAVCHNTSPYISLYKRSGDTLLKLSNPASLPASDPLCVAYYPPVPGA